MSLIGNPIERNVTAADFLRTTILGAVVMAICTFPPSGHTAEEEAKVKPEKSPDDVICKRQKVSGSHIKQRICFTREQWDEIRRQSQANAASAMRSGSQITPQ